MPLEPEFIGIEQDEDGIIPANIAKICEERQRSGKPMPKVSCKENKKFKECFRLINYI